MATVAMTPPSGIGGIIFGQNGTYVQNTDGTYTINTSDALDLLKIGFVYVKASIKSYTTPIAPAAASAAVNIASVALSSGALTIAAQPDVIRPVAVIMGTTGGTVTAGLVTMTYIANDGSTQTDTFSAVGIVSGTNSTLNTSKGVAHISTAFVGAVTGGTPFIYAGATAVLAVPVDLGAVDVAFYKENSNTADETIGTVNASILGSIAPSVAPNGTHTYSWLYGMTSPTT